MFRLLYLCSYLAFRLCEGLTRLLPLGFTFVIGLAGGELAYRILWRRRALALNNLRLAFDAEMSGAQLRALNRKHFQLLGANLLSGLKMFTMPDDAIWKRVTLVVPDVQGNTGWIALISHIGNWELYGHVGRKFPAYRYGAVYQPLANPYVDGHVQATRRKSGITLFDRRTQLLACVRFLREGGAVGLLADQGAGYAGLWTPLFRRLTSSSTLAARLSIRTGLPVVPLAVNTRGRARWELIVSKPIFPEGDDVESLTAQINGILEEQIRRSPADWLWAHNRWKPLRPHFLFTRDHRPVFFPPGFDRSRLDPFRILIVSPTSAEPAKATFSAVNAIKEGRPDTFVTILSPSESVDAWKMSPDADQILDWKNRDSVISLVSKIRSAGRFDVCIFFEDNTKVSIAAFMAGIPVRVGRRSGAGAWFCNQHPAEPNQAFDAVRMNLHIAQSVGANINAALAAARSLARLRTT